MKLGGEIDDRVADVVDCARRVKNKKVTTLYISYYLRTVGLAGSYAQLYFESSLVLRERNVKVQLSVAALSPQHVSSASEHS